MSTTERLFLGLNLDPLFQREISAAAEKLKVLFPDQKWVRFRFFHFTVHFLGDTTSDQKEKVISIARGIAKATKPFQIALEGMGAFPSLQKPRVIWIGAAEECRESLDCFYRKVTQPLVAEGFPVEHEEFTPHTTLFPARAEKPIIWDPKLFQFQKTSFEMMRDLTLFKSTPVSDGNEYQPCEVFPFEG